MSKNNKIDIIPNSYTAILCSNNVDKIKLGNAIKNKNDLIITTNAKDNSEGFDKKIVNLLKINSLMLCDFNTLSIGERQMVQISKALSSNFDRLIVVDAISNVSTINKEKILRYLKKYNNKTIIYITSNKEDIVYFENFILYDNKVILNDKLSNVLDKEKEFKLAGFDLPFMPLLSLKLKYYNLLDRPIISMDRMVDKLWK